MSQESKYFFEKLKSTCKKIDNDVKYAKELSENPKSSELATVRIRGYQDKTESLKKQSSELRNMLISKVAHTREFNMNFKELLADAETQVSKQENYLKQYGYKPLNLIIPPSDAVFNSPVKQICSVEKHPSTPSLLDYGIIRDMSSCDNFTGGQRTTSKLQYESMEKKGKLGSTPTLEISPVPELETPPMPEIVPTAVVFPSTPTLEL